MDAVDDSWHVLSIIEVSCDWVEELDQTVVNSTIINGEHLLSHDYHRYMYIHLTSHVSTYTQGRIHITIVLVLH